MAPSTGQWLQVRVWDAPTNGLLWGDDPAVARLKPSTVQVDLAGATPVHMANLMWFYIHVGCAQYRSHAYITCSVQMLDVPVLTQDAPPDVTLLRRSIRSAHLIGEPEHTDPELEVSPALLDLAHSSNPQPTNAKPYTLFLAGRPCGRDSSVHGQPHVVIYTCRTCPVQVKAIMHAYGTCSVQTFGSARTNSGRAAGRDLATTVHQVDLAGATAVYMANLTWPDEAVAAIGPLPLSIFLSLLFYIYEYMYKYMYIYIDRQMFICKYMYIYDKYIYTCM